MAAAAGAAPAFPAAGAGAAVEGVPVAVAAVVADVGAALGPEVVCRGICRRGVLAPVSGGKGIARAECYAVIFF